MVEKARTERNSKLKEQEPESERSLPILPVRDTVLFPHAVLPLTVGRESSVQLINSLGEDKTIVVVAQREARVDAPQASDLYTVGTLAVVHKVVKMSGCVWQSSPSLRRSCEQKWIQFRNRFRRRALK